MAEGLQAPTPWAAGFAQMARRVAAALGDGAPVSTRTELYRPLPADPMAWLLATFPTYFQSPAGVPISLAAHHEAFWAWVWRLRPGVAQRPFIAIWSRGGGKSTGLELASAVQGYFGLRRYVLYVCSTQKQADDHVANVATLLEKLGVDRAINRYGFSRGWNINRLRTADGYTEDAIGMDAALRGVRIDEARPDGIFLDELDEQLDTPETIAKKVDILTRKILPTGAQSLSVVGVQNLPNKDGIFAQLADGRAEFLLDREVSGPHPAMGDLPETDWYERTVAPDGTPSLRLLGGRPVWAGQDRAACDALLTMMGPRAFQIECHPAGTRIRVGMRTLVPIETLQPGMRVMTHCGRQRRITQTRSRLYTGDLLQFKRCGKREVLQATASHPFLMARRPSSRRWWTGRQGQGRHRGPGLRNTAALTYTWVEAQHIQKGDFFVEPVPRLGAPYSDGDLLWTFPHKSTGRRARGMDRLLLTPALARLLGYYLAEGAVLGDYCVQLTFHRNETDYIADVVGLCEKVFGIIPAVRESNGQSLVVCIDSVIAQEFFRWIGHGSRTKQVPEWMFRASPQCMEQLLIGYIRGDGCKDPSGFGYNTVSEQLAEDIRLLLLCRGIVAYVYKLLPRVVRLPQGTLYERSEHWQGDVNGGFAVMLGEIMGQPHASLGQNHAFIANGYVHYPVVKVLRHPVQDLPVYNCEVEEDESYIADGVASHNCQHRIALLEGDLFQRAWFPIVAQWPRAARLVRYWDFAATQEPETRRSGRRDPDWTVGLLLAMWQGQFYVVDMQRVRLSPKGVEDLVRQTASVDGRGVEIWLEEEGGSSGKAVTADYQQRVLLGYVVRTWHSTGSKGERAKPVSSAAEAGNVALVRANWNQAFLDEVCAFGLPNVHDDIVDALAGAHYALTLGQGFLPSDFSLAPALVGLTQATMAQRAQTAALLPAMANLWGVDGWDEDVL